MPHETVILLSGIVVLTMYGLVMSWLYAARTMELEERSLAYLVADDDNHADLKKAQKRRR